jgi:hypothetical protein
MPPTPVAVSTVKNDDESSSGVMVEDVSEDSSDSTSFPDEDMENYEEEEPFEDEVVLFSNEENATVMSIPSAGASTNRASDMQFDPLQSHVKVGGASNHGGLFPTSQDVQAADRVRHDPFAPNVMGGTPVAYGIMARDSILPSEDPFALIEDEMDSNIKSTEDDDDNFHDELPHESSKKKKKNKKSKKEKKIKGKKKGKKKKDSKVTSITYLEGDSDDDDDTTANASDAVSMEDRFEDEHQHDKKNKTTSTKSPPRNQGEDLEAALGAASSLAMIHMGMMNESNQSQEENVRFVLGDDELEEYNANDGGMDSEGVFLAKRRTVNGAGAGTMTLRESLRNVTSRVFKPPLVANERAMPSQEAWQDEDGFHDELVVFNHGEENAANPQDSFTLNTEEEENLFARKSSGYRKGLIYDRQSRKCWCYTLLALAIFLALFVPLCLVVRDNREYKEALEAQQRQKEQILSGIGTPVPAPTGDTPSIAPGDCLDKLVLLHNTTCFDTQTPISFSFTHCSPSVDDWIGLYPSNAVYYGRLWRDYINWIWACGIMPCTEEQVTESLPLTGTFEAPAMEPGEYQLFLVLDSRWPYRYLTSSEAFTVSDTC